MYTQQRELLPKTCFALLCIAALGAGHQPAGAAARYNRPIEGGDSISCSGKCLLAEGRHPRVGVFLRWRAGQKLVLEEAETMRRWSS